MRHALPIALLLLTSCAENSSEEGPLFVNGGEEEAQLAESLAWGEVEEAAPMMGVNAMDLQVLRVDLDELGMAHTRFRQTFKGIPVWQGEAIVHLNPDGSLRGLTNAVLPDILLDSVEPSYSPEEAIDFAVEATQGWQKVSDDLKVGLYVFRGDKGDSLAWRVEIPMIDNSNEPSKPVVFVDAHTGEVLWQYENLQTGTPATGTGTGYYSGSLSINTYLNGTSYYLEDTTRKLGTYTFNNTTSAAYYSTDADNVWGSSTQYTWVEAHNAARKVWDYYSTVHGRNGIDGVGGPGYISSLTGSGAVISSFTNYGSGYANAFWDGSAMYYGDGDGYSFGPLTTLDIAGHEMTHGVTDYTAGLVYSGESGGLNESMSDVFGALVEAYADGAVSSSTWRIGEDTYTPSNGTSDALRYMNDPAADGYSYDYYTSTIGNADVHYSSGLSNLAFYLLSQGGTHPRGKSNTSVTGVGTTKAGAIWYRALAVYMTSSTTFSGARTATLSAATDLYGSSSAEYAAVQNAWAAVGVGSAAGGGGSSTCTNYTYTNTGTLAGTGSIYYEPAGTYYTTSATGTHSASFTGPSGTNFNLYLQKYNSSKRTWQTVATSAGSTSTESISYRGSSGNYTWKVSSSSGGGAYTLCWTRP
ncbi:MAG TPA: M4 family metallopeptidase [Myxococcota bacterium]|nr:M4 family metallopeptidase [Myxococcota bacterium]